MVEEGGPGWVRKDVGRGERGKGKTGVKGNLCK